MRRSFSAVINCNQHQLLPLHILVTPRSGSWSGSWLCPHTSPCSAAVSVIPVFLRLQRGSCNVMRPDPSRPVHAVAAWSAGEPGRLPAERLTAGRYVFTALTSGRPCSIQLWIPAASLQTHSLFLPLTCLNWNWTIAQSFCSLPLVKSVMSYKTIWIVTDGRDVD